MGKGVFREFGVLKGCYLKENSRIAELRSRCILSTVLFSFFFCGSILWSVTSQSASNKSQSHVKRTKNEPIHIVSDRMEVDQDMRRIVFIGHVMAKKRDLTVLGDRMTVFYRKLKKEAGKKSKKQKKSVIKNRNDQTSQISKIYMKGNVKISKGDIIAIGDTADYYEDAQKLILQGNAQVSRGGDFISGKRVIIFLDENKSVVEGGHKEPVKATIYPHSGKYLKP